MTLINNKNRDLITKLKEEFEFKINECKIAVDKEKSEKDKVVVSNKTL